MAIVKLSFDFNPVVTTYHHLTHPLGIVGGNLPDKSVWFPWLCNKYINCCYTVGPQKRFWLYTVDPFFIHEGIIESLEFKMRPEKYQSFLNLNINIFTEQIKNILLSGSYIHGMHNERYVGATSSYGKRDFSHDYLLFGFSDELGGFYAAGYAANGRYQEYEIPYHEYYNSIFQVACEPLLFRVLRFNQKKPSYNPNYSVIIRDINHYLNSTAYNSNKEVEEIYGLSAWDKLSEYISQTDKIDIRFTKIFMEHHKLMNLRLKYFAEQGIIDTQTFKSYLPVKECSEIVYLSSIKYNITRRENIKNDIVLRIRKVIESDKEILPKVVQQIEKNVADL